MALDFHLLDLCLLDLALPRVCARCGSAPRDRRPLCARSLAALPRVAAHACARCQQAPASAPGQLCGGCAARPAPLTACVADAWFRGEVEDWIRRFKYPARGLSRLDPSAAALARTLVRHPFMTGKVVLGIHWQALKLWLKRVPVIDHPKNPSSTWHNPRYVWMINPTIVDRGPVKVKAGAVLALRYRLVVHDGPPPVDLLNELTAEWRKQ